MSGWVYGNRPGSESFQFSLYSNDHVREDGESEVDFSASVADISAVAQYTVGSKLDLSASTDWEVALIDFCMPTNLETFPSSGVENKSKAYLGVDLDYVYNGVHKKLLWEIFLPHVEYDIPSCIDIILDLVQERMVDWVPPVGGEDACGDYFRIILDISMDPISDFLFIRSAGAKEQEKFCKLIFPSDSSELRQISLSFSNELLSYLGDFDFSTADFKEQSAVFKDGGSAKVVWECPNDGYISTHKWVDSSKLVGISVRSSLVAGRELATYTVPNTSNSIVSDSSIVQWKPLKGSNSLDSIHFSITDGRVEIVSYKGGNIFFSIGIRRAATVAVHG